MGRVSECVDEWEWVSECVGELVNIGWVSECGWVNVGWVSECGWVNVGCVSKGIE